MKKQVIVKYFKRRKSFRQKLGRWLKKHFIPHPGNNHWPHALRLKMLRLYTVGILSVKFFLVLALFIVYPSAAAFGGQLTDELLVLTNQIRVENGAPALRLNPQLTAAAQAKANDMLARGYFEHTGPDGDKPWVWLEKFDYSYTAAGENLAKDFNSAASVQAAFLASPTHRQNIFNPRYQEIGLAVAYGELAGRQTAVLVEFFGTTEKLTAVAVNVPVGAAAYETEITAANHNPREVVLQRSVNEPYAISQVAGVAVDGQPLAEIEESGQPVGGPLSVNQPRGWAGWLIVVVDWLIVGLAIFLAAALALKVLIRWRIQHCRAIGYTVAVLVLLVVLVAGQWHFLEKIIQPVMAII